MSSALLLVLEAAWAGGSHEPGVRREGPVQAQDSLPEGPGLAAKYRGDASLAGDPAVLLFYDYEAPDSWRKGWEGGLKYYDHVTDPAHVFQGRGALQARLKKGTTGGGDHLRLRAPETCLFQRYYVKADRGFDFIMKSHGFGGVGPGLPDWYAQGKAGIKPTGTDKLYGIIFFSPKDVRPSLYYYHPGQKGGYGDHAYGRTPLPVETWTCLEIMLKVNEVGQNNGEIACWMDGRLTVRVKDLAWRTTPELGINLVLDHVYNSVPHDQLLWFDNRVVARRYIGPMARSSQEKAAEQTGRTK